MNLLDLHFNHGTELSRESLGRRSGSEASTCRRVKVPDSVIDVVVCVARELGLAGRFMADQAICAFNPAAMLRAVRVSTQRAHFIIRCDCSVGCELTTVVVGYHATCLGEQCAQLGHKCAGREH